MDIKNLAVKINRNLKRRRICYIIAFVVFLIEFLLELLLFFLVNINKLKINWAALDTIKFSDVYDWVHWVLFFSLILMSILDGMSMKKYTLEVADSKGITEDTVYTPISKKTMNWTLTSLICYSPFIVVILAVLSGLYGAYGLATQPMIVGHIFFIIAYADMKKYNNLFNAEEKPQRKIQAKKEQKITQAKKYLAKTGKIFFVDYYNQLKNYNTIDIIDVIQENYDEDTKKYRIINGKKIFSMNLQIEALNVILKNEDGLADQKIIDLTKLILEKETAEQLQLIEKQIKEKIEERKKQEILPNCSICIHNINEKSCKIWRKKTAEMCKEFKIKKELRRKSN